MTNMFTFIPSFILVQLFRRSPKRKTKTTKLRNIIKNVSNIERQNDAIKRQKKSRNFPWWLKIVAYILSFVCIAVCICLIIFKGKIRFIKKKTFIHISHLFFYNYFS
jgi:cell division protein FtsX